MSRTNENKLWVGTIVDATIELNVASVGNRQSDGLSSTLRTLGGCSSKQRSTARL